MPLHANSEYLRQTLENLPLLDNRYEQIRLINVPPVGEKIGNFSLVFKAWDKVDNKYVALKFYDIDPAFLAQQYRVVCFNREHAILQLLIGRERCLQLMSAMKTFDLALNIPGSSAPIVLPCQYFAVEWIEDQVDQYFFNQHAHEAINKLNLFSEIALSIEALHTHEVFHRDIKANNLRSYQNHLKRIVVAIDLGTAARFDSNAIASAYPSSAGFQSYAAPEALSGLAGLRDVARSTDIYAAGCLLFELFTKDLFFAALLAKNSGFHFRLGAMQQYVANANDDAQRINAWSRALRDLGGGVASPSVDGAGTSCPPGITSIVDEVVAGLTHIDYRRRMPLNLARQKIRSAIKLLTNERLYQLSLARRREIREARVRKIEERRLRLTSARSRLESKS